MALSSMSCLGRRGRSAAAVLTALTLLAGGCNFQRHRVSGADPPGVDDVLPRCRVAGSTERPFVVEWKGTDRGALELALQRGPVVVRHSGCELEVLRQCRTPGGYKYAGFTRKRDTLAIHDADELYALMPVGAATLEGTLARTGQLQLDMTIVGMLEVDASVARGDLEGACEGATHVISGAHVGAFVLSAGERTELAAHAGPTRTSATETINADGSPRACETAAPTDVAAPIECGAIVRLELAPLLSHRPVAARVVPVETPAAEPPAAIAVQEPPAPIAVQEAPRAELPLEPLEPGEPAPAELVAPVAAPRAMSAGPSPSDVEAMRAELAARHVETGCQLSGTGCGFAISGGILLAVGLAAGIPMTTIGFRRISAIDDELATTSESSPDFADLERSRDRAANLGGAGAWLLLGIPLGAIFTVIGARHLKWARLDQRRGARVNVTPTFGRTHGGLAVSLRF